MATTQTAKGTVDWGAGHLVNVAELSTIDPGLAVNVLHAGPTGMNVLKVEHEVVTQPTSKDPVSVSHVRANDSIVNDTCSIVVDTVAGGDLAGAVVRLYFKFQEAAAGGIS